MDSFKEQIVTKLPTKNDGVTKACIMVGCVALAFALIIFTFSYFINFSVIAIFAACFAVYGGILLIQRMNIEYEYIFTNGEIDIDKIIAQKSRKRLCTIKVSSATSIGKVDDNFSVADGRTVVMASACDSQQQDYYIDVTHKSFGDTTLVFTPDNDMLKIIKTALPRNIRSTLVVPENTDEG